LTLNSVDFKTVSKYAKLNIVSIVYSLHAGRDFPKILNFDPRVMTFYCLFAIMNYMGVFDVHGPFNFLTG